MERCSICGRDDAGCVVREEGGYCYGKPAVVSRVLRSRVALDLALGPRRRTSLADIVEEYVTACEDPNARRFAVGLGVQAWGHALRAFLGLPRLL